MAPVRSALAAFLACKLLLGTAWAQSVEPQPVRFDSADGTPLIGWLFRPADAAPKGTVVALHGCGGLYATTGARRGRLNARHQAMAEMLVQEGYAVLLPDSLTSRGVGQLCTLKAGQRSIDQRERRNDALAALQWVAAQPWAANAKTAVLGWSHGGSAVLAVTDGKQADVAAATQRFAVAIAFYPGCAPARKSGYQPNTRLVLMLAEKDDWTAPGPCIELGKSVGAETHVYPDSYHGFDNPVGDERLRLDVPGGTNPGRGVHVGRNAAAREQAYARVREVLRETLQQP